MEKTFTKNIFTFLLLFFSSIVMNAQTWAWAKGGEGVTRSYAYEKGCDVAADGNGNVYATGTFSSATIVFGTYTLTNSGNWSIYLVKYDASGNVLWVKSPVATGFNYASSVSTDASGNVYLTGHYSTPAIAFDSFTLTTSSPGSMNVYLVKYDANGSVLWARQAGGEGTRVCTSGCVDASGNIFITGYFYSATVTFGTYTLTNTLGTAIFLAKYDAAGNVLWAKGTTGAGSNVSKYVCTDGIGNAYISGYFISNNKLGFGTDTVFNVGNTNGFFAKYDANGNVSWAKSIGGPQQDKCLSVCTDATNNLYVTGCFTSTLMTFGTNTFTIPYNGVFYPYLYLAKYSPAGNLAWYKMFKGGTGYSVAASGNDIFIGGTFSNTMVIANKTLTAAPQGTLAPDPFFIARYSLNGIDTYATALSSGGDYAEICTDNACSVYVTGTFSNPTDFVVGTTTLTQAGSKNAYVAKLSSACTVGIEETAGEDRGFLIFPNPNSGSFKVEMDEGSDAQLVLFNALGQKVYTQKMTHGTNEVITADLRAGLYNAFLQQENRQTRYCKLIIE